MAVTPAQSTAVRLGLQASPEHFDFSQGVENQAAAGLISGATADALKGQNLMETRFSPAIAAIGAYPYQIGQEVFRDVRDQGISGIGSGFLRGAKAGWNNLRGMGAGLYNRFNPEDTAVPSSQVGGFTDPYGLKTILPNINTLYPPTDPSVVDRALRGEELYTAPNQRDQGEFTIGQIQNLLNTAERELSPGGDTTIGGRLRGYLPFLRSAQEQLKMAQPILTIPREGEQAETFGYQSAAQNLIPTIEGIQRQQQYIAPQIDTFESMPEPSIAETIQPDVEYSQQSLLPWNLLLGGIGMMTATDPGLGGAIGTRPFTKVRGDAGDTWEFPIPYLDYPGDTADERLQEHITSRGIQRAITGGGQPLTNIFQGDTGVGTDLQSTPEEAMTSNIRNALTDYAYGRDVQPELQAITELTEADPTFNFEKYLDPTSQEVMDITSQVESFADMPAVPQPKPTKPKGETIEQKKEAAAQKRRDKKAAAKREAADKRAADKAAAKSARMSAAQKRNIAKVAKASRKAEAKREADTKKRAQEQRDKLDSASKKALQDHMAWMATQTKRVAKEEKKRAKRYAGGKGGALMYT